MSRIGKKPIDIPDGVKVKLNGNTVSVEGPKGNLTRKIIEGISIEVADKQVVVKRPNDQRQTRANQGLARALIANMVNGVHQGFEKVLEISGVGYKAEVTGKVLQLALGYSHRIDFPIPDQINIKVDAQTKVSVSGIDRELVGQTAARIRQLKRPDPYKAKGITYEGERILRKAGKKAIG